MEKFYLELPSLKRENEIIDYINEFVTYNSAINGMGSLNKILEGYTFKQALERCLNMQDEEYAKKLGRCQAKTFLLIREKDNKIVGTINIRWNLTEKLKRFGGNIGYGIRPLERRCGYNKINLYLGMLEAKKLGLEQVMLDCDVNNLGSRKTIEALGGKLTRTEIKPSDGILTNVYLFDVQETINQYKKTFENNIKKDNMIKVIAFDLVGVLVSEKDIKLTELEEKLERMFGPNLNDEDYLLNASKIDKESDIITITNDLINKLYTLKNENILKKLKQEKPNIKLIVATNHLSYVKKYIEKNFNDYLDDIIISASIHKIKPNKDFYQYILDKFQIKPNELLFLDDNKDNILKASELGINTIIVSENTDLILEINNFINN